MADRNPNPENVSKDSNSAELKSADDMRFDVVEKKGRSGAIITGYSYSCHNSP